MSIGEKEKNGIGGASNSAPQNIFERNLKAFTEFAKQKGAELDDDGKLVFQGVVLADDIESEVAVRGGDEELIDPKRLWRELMFLVNLEAWREYLDDKGARYDENGRLWYNDLLLTKDDEGYLAASSDADEELLTEENFEALFDSLLFLARKATYKANLKAWREFVSYKGAYNEDGWLCFKGKRLTPNEEKYLLEASDGVEEHFLTREELEELWKNLLDYAGVSEEDEEENAGEGRWR